MTIRFYSNREQPYGCFSNFSPHGFDLDGRWWPTSEHYFQAQKFAGTAREQVVRQASGPMEAARLGRDRRYPVRSDWEQVKDAVMRRAVQCKFETHADIRATLLATDDELIVEAAEHDSYWGCGADSKGLNRLGTTLMDVRRALRQQPESSQPQTA
ncbi:MAG: NADAR family protein [Chloroflexi bacterium]|nr:NADAR family protein [Chloroflexota bacterium]